MAEIKFGDSEFYAENNAGQRVFDANRNNVHIIGNLQGTLDVPAGGNWMAVGAAYIRGNDVRYYWLYGWTQHWVTYDISQWTEGFDPSRIILFPYYKLQSAELTGAGRGRLIDVAQAKTTWIYGGGGVVAQMWLLGEVQNQESLIAGYSIVTSRIEEATSQVHITYQTSISGCFGGNALGQSYTGNDIKLGISDGGLEGCVIQPNQLPRDANNYWDHRTSSPSYYQVNVRDFGQRLDYNVYIGIA